MGTRVLVILAVIAASGTRAEAGSDYRPQDRWFFALSAGVGVEKDIDDERDAVIAYETSYWANDFIAFGTLVTLSRADTYDFGGELMLALPLRYIQVYGGAQLGWRSAPFHDVEGRIGAFAGVNLYASRNLRLFGEIRDLPQLDVPEVTGGKYNQVALGGLRWSPDAFHRRRGVSKINYVWWSTALSFALWGAVTHAR